MGVSVKGVSKSSSAKGASSGWLVKDTKQSLEMEKQAKAEAEERKSRQGKMFEFFMKEEEEGVQVTFIDGDLTEDGFFAPPRFYQHTIWAGGKPQSYVCPEKTNPGLGMKCPLCEDSDPDIARSSLVALFTVIDHRTFEGKDGKKYANRPKILKAKQSTTEMLAKIAQKRGGLAGCKFDVIRSGEKSPAVGSMYDFVDKTDVDELRAKYTVKEKDEKGNLVNRCLFEPADYDEEIVFRTEDELRSLGFGKGVSAMSGGSKSKTSSSKNFENEL